MRVLHWLSRLVTDDDGQCLWIEALERGLDDPTTSYASCSQVAGPSFPLHCTGTLGSSGSEAEISTRDLQLRNNDATVSQV
jgi:hypothetical protein